METLVAKICRACGETKPVTEFYRHAMMTDGRLNFCRSCVCERVKAHRTANADRIRQYDRDRGFRPRLRQKQKAADTLNAAIRNGSLARQPCERCGATEKIDAHHEDYSKPLDVVWLCKPCHGLRHREISQEYGDRKHG